MMKTELPYNVLNLRKPISHISFLLFSLAATLVLFLSGKSTGVNQTIGLFFVLFIQLEVFISLGYKLFADVDFDRSPGEVTRVILLRFLAFLGGCLLASLIIVVIVQIVLLSLSGKDPLTTVHDFFYYEILKWFKSTITGLSSGAVIFVFLLWQASLKREQKLREEKLIFQNETLKGQVNPHFLFNCLNTISSLIKTQPDTAELFINNLSAVYRYILENGQKDRVTLKSELGFINDYFNLHKIRDDGKIILEDEIENADRYEIIPVSLQILIENAIKHNIATRENPLKISIRIDDKYIVVKNNLQRKATQFRSTGIGLRNLAERIRLVSGKVMEIEETDTDFTVKVPLLP